MVVALASLFTVTGVAVSGHRAGHGQQVQLADWTVARQADGNVRVTIRKLRDPAGLQRALRAAGIPANVTLAPALGLYCRPFLHGSGTVWRHGVEWNDDNVFSSPPSRGIGDHIIHPGHLPAGTGVRQTDGVGGYLWSHGQRVRTGELGYGLVYASPRCTG